LPTCDYALIGSCYTLDDHELYMYTLTSLFTAFQLASGLQSFSYHIFCMNFVVTTARKVKLKQVWKFPVLHCLGNDTVSPVP